jgi:hypothetical protein
VSTIRQIVSDLLVQYPEVISYLAQATEVPTDDRLKKPYYDLEESRQRLFPLVDRWRSEPAPRRVEFSEMWDGSPKELTAMLAQEVARFGDVQAAFTRFLKGNREPPVVVSEEVRKVRDWMRKAQIA